MRKNPDVATLVANWSRKRWAYGDFSVFLLRAKALGSSNIQNAVAKRLKVIGDVAKDMPSELNQKKAEMTWYKISEMIDQLGYESVGLEPVQTWILIMNKLPELKKKIEKIYDKQRIPETLLRRLR